MLNDPVYNLSRYFAILLHYYLTLLIDFFSISSRVLTLHLIIVVDAISGHFFISRDFSYRANSRQNHCQQNGGSCEPMFGCLLKQGYMSGACHGFLSVCCVQPTFVSRRFKENSIFESGPPVST